MDQVNERRSVLDGESSSGDKRTQQQTHSKAKRSMNYNDRNSGDNENFNTSNDQFLTVKSPSNTIVYTQALRKNEIPGEDDSSDTSGEKLNDSDGIMDHPDSINDIVTQVNYMENLRSIN